MRHEAEPETLIGGILPACVVSVEVRRDLPEVALFPEEEVLIGRAVEKRRREFTTARGCARKALAALGWPATPIPAGERGEPQWPAGVVGSITHCDGYRACAVARAVEIATVGIDAEPNAALPDGVLGDIARPEERPRLKHLRAERPEVHWDRLVFSAKESVYKAWFPLAHRWLGFEDATIEVDPDAGTFTAQLHVPGLSLGGRRLSRLSGTWTVGGGILATAVVEEW
jgi:4'-phosphopantetheinyl transferase EntD